jgi:dihydrofolate reductase
MRRIFWFEMASLDGYHESEQAGLDWHHVDAEFLDFVLKQLGEADTLLSGRRTYEHMPAFWPNEAGQRADPAVAEVMNGLPKVVVSGTLTAAGWAPAAPS